VKNEAMLTAKFSQNLWSTVCSANQLNAAGSHHKLIACQFALVPGS